MQIQRIQTLWLLIAAILIGINCFVPLDIPIVEKGATDSVFLVFTNPILLIINITLGILVLVNIFLYNNLRQQITVNTVSLLLLLCDLGLTVYNIAVMLQCNADRDFNITSPCLIIAAVIFVILAGRGMRHDKKLLSSADRIR